MGNKLSSCGPLIKKSYRYDDVAGPFQSSSRRRDGHLLRLWAEVFHVSAKGEEIKWQQISEDLVPVNITCVQDAPDYIFHITAYNSQVEKIMDIRLVQPGTKIGLASECFAYWKEPHTNDTWGLNFTSPIDAKQFKECCTPSMKLSRKSSSSYSLKLDTSKRQSTKVRRKPLSTPTSPSRSREPQCTCMTADQFNRLRAQDPRYNKERSSTLPRSHTRQLSLGDGPSDPDKKLSAEDTTKQTTISRSSTTRDRETATPGGKLNITGTGSQTEQGQQQDSCKSEAVQTVGAKTTTTTGTCTPRMLSKDYSEGYGVRILETDLFKPINVPKSSRNQNKAYRDDYRYRDGMGTMKRTLKPMPSLESPATSPEMTRRRGYSYYHQAPPASTMNLPMPHCSRQAQSESESSAKHRNSRFGTLGSRSSYDIGRAEQSMRDHPRGLYLELDRNGRPTQPADGSPLSDTVMFDNQCYATTPSSSNGRGYQKHDNQATSTPGSPTSRLLLEYEMHLRNTLARGMDAESYSLHTFEALLTQSMENLEMAEQLPPLNSRSPYPTRRRPMSAGGSFNRSSTLPHRVERSSSATREGYYSDRQDAARERDRERGYLSDHAPSSNRCANCWNESARAHWFRHSDGWRCGSSTMGSGTSSINCVPPHSSFDYVHHHTPPGKQSKRSAWESLPSLRHENSLAADNACKYNRNDSFEQRMFERQDSGRLDYMNERAARHSFSGITQQASVESTDSRLCYLTSSEISDDDRMSLTTAISDEDDGESNQNSPYRGKQTGSAAASFNCTGAVRKAGFLSVKKWLLRKKHQIELARKRGWKGYWVCLKGTTLLFYPCDSREGRSVEAAPRHLIIVDGAIMQPIPEHPKRDYIFCLSTAFGDAYLFQAPCQVELENWVNSIHSACGAAFARHRGKIGTLHLLQEEIYRIEKQVEADQKLKHMAEIQVEMLSDPDTKEQILKQVLTWEENLERLHCEQFRLKCYMASLQNGELPNPKILLTRVSRATKITLNKLGVFTVSSLHAFICARSPSLLNNLLAGRGATKRKTPILSRSNSGSGRRSLQTSTSREEQERTVKVSLPDNQSVQIHLREGMTVEEYLAFSCSRKGLNPMEHFVRVKKRRDMEDHNYFVPPRTDSIETYLHTHEVVEVRAKILYQVELERNTLDHMWGFSVEAELIENSDRQDELCCYVSRVEDKGIAIQNGIIKGDEIMVINSAIVSDLDMMYLESALQEELSLSMMMRSSRTEPPQLPPGSRIVSKTTDDIIQSLVCPPPPTDPPMISEEMISGLIVPAPNWNREGHYDMDTTSAMQDCKLASRGNSFEIENLIKSAGEVTGFCRSPEPARRISPTIIPATHNPILTIGRQLTDAEKLRKVICELVDTEKSYIKHLNNLLENYLEPLKQETFLSGVEIAVLFGNIQEIVQFQHQFLQNLEEPIRQEPNFYKFDQPEQFKNILFSIGSAFLYYVNHFKLYSSFCASHSKAQKILNPNEGNQALQEFLCARNPRQQHSCSLESYLIKPIQRILKYPLLLQQLRNLTDPTSDQHLHLVEALKGMENVAEHINEMQRIHEEYGTIFDHLFRQHQKSCKQAIDLSPGDLLYYGGVEWLNISDFLGKIKKGVELHAMCFVFKSAVVFLCKERLRQKKKLMSASGKNEMEVIRYQVLVPVTEVQVRASSAKDMETHFLWELIHLRSQAARRPEKIYVLSNSTTEFRNAFLKTIRQIIRESVRNMSIPTAKPTTNSASQLVSNTATLGRQTISAGTSQHNKMESSKPPTTPSVPQGSQTLGKPKKIPPKPPQRHSSGSTTVTKVELQSQGTSSTDSTTDTGATQTVLPNYRSRIKDDKRDSQKSEGEDDSGSHPGPAKSVQSRGSLGKTPNYLMLSTTSTLSASSTGSQAARLVERSQQPENYQPPQVQDLGSPVWKPREPGESLTLPRKKKPAQDKFETRTMVRKCDSKKDKK
ncbi:protein still life, isoform SIF type 1 isoform X3 [Adelges cooleyi]|uniref:protein still life, isoform SIF type 1 isoform X3 n=1 Tax=Adelges cooleyi TaxID=133065 RepID=UPI00217F4382|nr:protein still life, isoform SIF type 1 isoform X3 [Adelges cooleyi]